MHKLTHQFVVNIINPGRYFDAGSNLHLLVRSGPAGPDKYWIYRLTLNESVKIEVLESFRMYRCRRLESWQLI